MKERKIALSESLCFICINLCRHHRQSNPPLCHRRVQSAIVLFRCSDVELSGLNCSKHTILMNRTTPQLLFISGARAGVGRRYGDASDVTSCGRRGRVSRHVVS